MQNYKLDNAYRVIAGTPQQPGIVKVPDMTVANVKTFTKLLQDLEPVLIPYFEKRKELTAQYTETKADGKVDIKDGMQAEFQNALEALAKEESEFKVEKFNITLKKGERRFTIDFNKAFEDLYGDAYNLVEVE